jgi:hypothetical protein
MHRVFPVLQGLVRHVYCSLAMRRCCHVTWHLFWRNKEQLFVSEALVVEVSTLEPRASDDSPS